MNDRELLELAAKAAGVRGYWSDEKNAFIRCINPALKGFSAANYEPWTPLDDNDHVFRLLISTMAKIAPDAVFEIFQLMRSDAPVEQIRRAIVRAAASIGGQKP